MSEERIAVLSDALKSIAKNTCCGNCQEAALVARAALASYVGAVRDDGWEPIETAPKEGNVILWDDGVMGEGYYDGERDCWWWANQSPYDFEPCREVFPTLWHPMPAPPSRVQAVGE